MVTEILLASRNSHALIGRTTMEEQVQPVALGAAVAYLRSMPSKLREKASAEMYGTAVAETGSEFRAAPVLFLALSRKAMQRRRTKWN